MSLLSLVVDLFVLLVVVSLVALIVRSRNVGVRFNIILLLIVGVLVLTVLSLGKLVGIMFGVILLLSISFSLLLTRKIR
ncbi:MAG: hypothetical protein ABSF00_01485 [Candidatus Bathyarchaeia archaeon]|jgi:hypothetical protein